MISKKIIKGFTIATLSVCCCITAGFGFKTANALAEQISVTSLVTTAAETTVSADGLTMQSNDSYEGQIKGVFEMGTNLSLDFTWLDETAFYIGNFGIRITDAADPNNYFDVVWKNNSYQNKWTTATLENAGLTGVYTTSDVRYTTGLTHVQWGDEIRSANPTNNILYTVGQQAYPYFTRDTSIQDDCTLQLVWDKDANAKDILVVTVAGKNNGKSNRVRAVFDGTYDETAIDKGFLYDSANAKNNQWGLPYLDFSNGYTLSFFSSFSSTKTTDKSTDVVFKKLTLGGSASYTYLPNTNNTKHKTCTLTGGTEYNLATTEKLAAPSFYETYQTYPFITVEKHASLDNIRKGGKMIIPNATWVSASSPTAKPVENIYVAFNGVETQVTAGSEYTPLQAGEYTLIYETNGRRQKESFTVVDYKSFESKDIVSIEGATGGIGVDIGGNGGYLVTAEKGVAYSGEILGNFYGNANVKFSFPHAITDKKEVAGATFVYTVCDLAGNEVLNVVYKTSGAWTNCYVQFGKEVRTYGYGKAGSWSTHYWYKEVTGDNVLFAPYLSYGGNTRETAAPGELGFIWDGDVFQVVANYYHESSGRDKMVTIAAFDGSDKDFEKPALGYVTETEFTAWGLPKLENLKDGYKIKFSCDNFVKDIPLNIIEVNGVKPYTKNYLDTSYSFETVFGDTVAINGETVYIPQGVEFPEVYGVYSIMLTKDWGFKMSERLAASIDTSLSGVKTLTITSNTYDEEWTTIEKTYTVNVETANTLTFETNGGKQIAPIIYSENTLSRISIRPAERVFWVFDGWYEDSALTEAFDGDVNAFIGRDATLYAKWRDVESPTINLKGNIAETSVGVKFTKITIGDFDVLAEDAAQNDTVKVTLEVKVPNGEFVSVTSPYNLVFEQGGEYEIRYTATDAAGLTDTVTRKVVVLERQSPVITVVGEVDTFGLEGEKIDLATVTATDSDGNALTASIYVLFEDEEMEVTSNAFTAVKVGEYTVVIVAEDAFGLFGSYEYVVTVEKDELAPTIVTEFKDCSAQRGSTVTIPNVSVEDNSRNTSLEITVWYGTEEVVMTNGSFKAEKSGVYRVVMRAFDGSGNVSEKVVQVTVEVEESRGIFAGIVDFFDALFAGFSDRIDSCSGTVSVSSMVGVIGGVSATLFIKKKEKKGDKNNGKKSN